MCVADALPHKKSQRQAKPARNVHFYNVGFSNACLNSQNSNRSSCHVTLADTKHFSTDVIIMTSPSHVILADRKHFITDVIIMTLVVLSRHPGR